MPKDRDYFSKESNAIKSTPCLWSFWCLWDEWILWAYFPSCLATVTSCSWLIMFLNGLKKKPQYQMMPNILSSFLNLTFLWDLLHLGLWLMIEGGIFATRWWKLYWRSTMWAIVSLPPITPKWMDKQKFWVEKSRPCLRKQWIQQERIGV